MGDAQSFLLTLHRWLQECPNDALSLWMCWGEKKENLTPWLPGSLELQFLQGCTLWDEAITKTESGGLLENRKGSCVTNVRGEAFVPISHSPNHFNSIQQMFIKYQSAVLGSGHSGKRGLLYFITNRVAFSGALYYHSFFLKTLFF